MMTGTLGLLFKLSAWGMAAIIFWRCMNVVRGMHFSTRRCALLHFYLFGAGYIMLAVAAIGAAMHISEGAGITGEWLWLTASTFLIVADRRRRRPLKAGS